MLYTRSHNALAAYSALAAGIVVYAADSAQAQRVTPPAGAEAAPNASQVTEIVVTARKSSENIQKVPIAVTALTPQILARANIKDAIDIRFLTPGLYTTPGAQDTSGLYFNIRGQQAASGLAESSVGTYVDGVYRQTQLGLNGALFDIERVEILKGPQGTLYGKNTSGGVVNIISRKPNLDEFGGYVTASLGANASTAADTSGLGERLEAVVNLPLVAGKAALRLSANYVLDDGYGRDGNNRPLNNHNDPYIRAQLRFKPSERWDVVLAGDYGSYNSNGQLVVLSEVHPGVLADAVGVAAGLIKSTDLPTAANPAGGPTYATGLPPTLAILSKDLTDGQFYKSNGTGNTYSDVRTGGVGLTITGDLTDSIKLKSISAFRALTMRDLNDDDGTKYTQIAASFADNSDFYSQEFNLSGEAFGNRLEWLTGSFYSYFDDLRGGIPGVGTIALTALSGTRLLYENKFTTDSIGFFGHSVFKVTDALSVTAGVRWSRDSRTIIPLDQMLSADGSAVVGCQLVKVGTVPLPGATLANGCTSPMQRHSDGGISYEAAINYQITSEIMVYGTTRRGFRSGDFNTNAQYLPYLPEIATDYEVGLKSVLFNHRFLFDVAAYYTDYENIQKSTTVVDFGPPISAATVVSNAAKARIDGVEAQLELRPIEGFDISGTYTYTDAKYTKFLQPTTMPGVFKDLSSDVFQVPEHMLDIASSYSIKMGEGRDLTVSGNFYYQSAIIFGQNSNLTASEQILRQNPYWLINGRITYAFQHENTSISFFVNNLADLRYNTSAGALRSFGISYLTPGPPRFVGLEFTTHFR